MGEWTRSAVIRFQSRHRLSQTGNLDRATTRKLYDDGATAATYDRYPTRGTGRRIVISQRQDWVWLVAPAGGSSTRAG